VQRAINANKAAREALRRIIDDDPGPQMLALLIARAANALGTNLEALQIIGRIGELARKRGQQDLDE
jgi:predicted Zn-dependent protease